MTRALERPRREEPGQQPRQHEDRIRHTSRDADDQREHHRVDQHQQKRPEERPHETERRATIFELEVTAQKASSQRSPAPQSPEDAHDRESWHNILKNGRFLYRKWPCQIGSHGLVSGLDVKGSQIRYLALNQVLDWGLSIPEVPLMRQVSE